MKLLCWKQDKWVYRTKILVTKSRGLGQSVSKTAGLVGCSWSTVVNSKIALRNDNAEPETETSATKAH